jgi:F-type H+-transporting ATPase subunit a
VAYSKLRMPVFDPPDTSGTVDVTADVGLLEFLAHRTSLLGLAALMHDRPHKEAQWAVPTGCFLPWRANRGRPGEHSFDSRPLFPGVLPDWVNNHVAQAVIGAILVIALLVWMSRNLKTVVPTQEAVRRRDSSTTWCATASPATSWATTSALPAVPARAVLLHPGEQPVRPVLRLHVPDLLQDRVRLGPGAVPGCSTTCAGIRRRGLLGYLKHATLPAGVPKLLWILIIPLEFLSNIIVRPLTLGLRLFANLFAGHLVIMVFVVGGTMLLTTTQPLQGFPIPLLQTAGVVSLLFSFAIFALELLVGSIQAYIFTVLTAQYVASAISDDH